MGDFANLGELRGRCGTVALTDRVQFVERGAVNRRSPAESASFACGYPIFGSRL